MTNAPFTNYRVDWDQFCNEKPEQVADELRQLLAATQGVEDAADVLLASVVGRARTHQDMARLVLQRVLPGLIGVAKRRSRMGLAGFNETLHDLVATSWIVICNYPLARRPRKIAANLVRDAEYFTFVQPYRLRHVDLVPVGAKSAMFDLSPAGSGNPGEEVVRVLVDARRAGVDPIGLKLLGELSLGGRTVEQLAEDYGVTTRTILNRRRAAERALVALAA